MALAVIRPIDTQQRIHHLLMQWQNGTEQDRLLEEARQCVMHYERVYKLPSEHIHQAIDAGDLEETLDVSHWILLYNLLQRAGQT
jgi:hypothetical protein